MKYALVRWHENNLQKYAFQIVPGKQHYAVLCDVEEQRRHEAWSVRFVTVKNIDISTSVIMFSFLGNSIECQQRLQQLSSGCEFMLMWGKSTLGNGRIVEDAAMLE